MSKRKSPGASSFVSILANSASQRAIKSAIRSFFWKLDMFAALIVLSTILADASGAPADSRTVARPADSAWRRPMACPLYVAGCSSDCVDATATLRRADRIVAVLGVRQAAVV